MNQKEKTELLIAVAGLLGEGNSSFDKIGIRPGSKLQVVNLNEKLDVVVETVALDHAGFVYSCRWLTTDGALHTQWFRPAEVQPVFDTLSLTPEHATTMTPDEELPF